MATIGSSVVQYRVVNSQRDRVMAQFEKLPQVKTAIADFQKKASGITNVDQLLKDRRSLEFVLSAFQLEDQINSRAIIKKVLTEDPAASGSLANMLSDPRYKAMAKAMQPLGEGKKPFANAEFMKQMISGYQTNAFEKFQGEQTPGLREAMFFKRNIGSVTTGLQVLGNKVLTEVVRVAIGMPKEMGLLSASKQAEIIEKRVDISQFKDPKFVDRFIDRYLANNDRQNAGGGSSNPMLALLQGSSGGGSLSILA
jgi:hypothetical protein